MLNTRIAVIRYGGREVLDVAEEPLRSLLLPDSGRRRSITGMRILYKSLTVWPPKEWMPYLIR
ncbi:MAG: hypothetical protein K0S39_4081 [Paenibacillus sp.]|jgi:hypothetical protein|nr:hypothetical protein [Paenibacillus sp.]